MWSAADKDYDRRVWRPLSVVLNIQLERLTLSCSTQLSTSQHLTWSRILENWARSIVLKYTTSSLRSKRFRLVSEQRKTEERDSRFWPREKWNKSEKMKVSSPPPPRSFTCAIFRAVFDSRSSFFAPKPHGNACYAGYTTCKLCNQHSTWETKNQLCNFSIQCSALDINLIIFFCSQMLKRYWTRIRRDGYI